MHYSRMISVETDLGWLGFLVNQGRMRHLKFGFASEILLLQSFDALQNFEEAFDPVRPNRNETQWSSQLKKFAAGQSVDLGAIPVDFSSFSSFQTKILQRCRKIPYGCVLSYGQLAKQANHPNAARAVGTAMKKNNVPLIVPCHRVVSSNGIGGYSASAGIAVKRKLLTLEGVQFK